MSVSSGRSSPGVRSHQGPRDSAASPAVCDSSCAIVAEPATPRSPRSRSLPTGSARSISPSARRRMISTATNIFVSEPMRYWMFPSGSWSSSMLREPHHTWPPSLTTAPTSDGVRPSACPTATRRSSARRVAGNNSADSLAATSEPYSAAVARLVGRRRGGIPAELRASGGHREVDEPLAGRLVHLPQVEDRQPVEQGAEPQGEVVGRGRRGERPLLHAAVDDRGEFVAPQPQLFLEELAHLPVVRRAGPYLHPEDPAGVRRAGGQVEADELLEPPPGTGHLTQRGAGPLDVLTVPPDQRLEQNVLFAVEVVHHLAGAHAGPTGYLGHPHLVNAGLGDQVKGGLEHAVAAALAVLGAGRTAAPGRGGCDLR